MNKPVEYDPECLKFCRNSADNDIVDKLIRREMEQIDAKRKPAKPGVVDITPHYYNFYIELLQRLKKRMRENRRNFRFRKPAVVTAV